MPLRRSVEKSLANTHCECIFFLKQTSFAGSAVTPAIVCAALCRVADIVRRKTSQLRSRFALVQVITTRGARQHKWTAEDNEVKAFFVNKVSGCVGVTCLMLKSGSLHRWGVQILLSTTALSCGSPIALWEGSADETFCAVRLHSHLYLTYIYLWQTIGIFGKDLKLQIL